MARGQGNGNLLPWSRENKRGGKPQLQTRSQTAARATRREGCGGAASDACGCPWPGEVLPQCLQPAISHRALLLPVKCVLLRSQVNSEAQSCPEPRQLCHCWLQYLLSSRQLPCTSWAAAAWAAEVTSGEKNAPFLPTTTGGRIF